MEYVRKCEVCGKIYCYTDDDLKKNSLNSFSAGVSAIGTIASLFGGGSMLTSAYLNEQSDKYADKVIDYTKCPSCNSSRTYLIDDNSLNVKKNENDVESQVANQVANEKTSADYYGEYDKYLNCFASSTYIDILNAYKQNEIERENRRLDIHKNIDEINEKVEVLRKQIALQNEIINNTKGKLFGQAGKDKRGAKNKISQLEVEINNLIVKEKMLKDDYNKAKGFLEKNNLNSKVLSDLPNDIADHVNYIKQQLGIAHVTEKFVNVYTGKSVVEHYELELLNQSWTTNWIVDLFVNDDEIVISYSGKQSNGIDVPRKTELINMLGIFEYSEDRENCNPFTVLKYDDLSIDDLEIMSQKTDEDELQYLNTNVCILLEDSELRKLVYKKILEFNIPAETRNKLNKFISQYNN